MKSDKKKNKIEVEQVRSRLAFRPARVRAVTHISLLALLCIIIYSNTFQAPFVFDDTPFIIDNPAVRDMNYFVDGELRESGIADQKLDVNFRTRIVTFFSFALNYRMGGLNVTGYHAVNLFVHVVNGLLVYWLVMVTLRAPNFLRLGGQRGLLQEDGIAALFAALLFVSHPIQTQAVTYISQRFTSLATLFYLLSLLMYGQARLAVSGPEMTAVGGLRKAHRSRRFLLYYGVSILSAVLAMLSKEIAFTLPVVIVLYEYLFFEGETRKRLLYSIPLLLTMLIIPWSVLSHPTAHDEVAGLRQSLLGDGPENPVLTYVYTQFRVIVTYLRLIVLPVDQNVDYDYPRYASLFEADVFLSALFLIALFSLAVLFYRKSREERPDGRSLRLAAFGIFWFFITLSVESSVLPLKDLIFEHRLYLPSVGIFLFAVGVLRTAGRGTTPGKQRVILVLAITVIGLWSVTAYARNGIWEDRIALWEDSVRKSPAKARPRFSLGSAYMMAGRTGESISEFEAAINADPKYVEAYRNLGIVYTQQGDYDAAVQALQRAIALQDDVAAVHSNLGVVYEKVMRLKDAEAEHLNALKLDSGLASAHSNLGLIYLKQDRLDKAIVSFRTAVMLNPGYSDFHYNLGVALETKGDLAAAVTAYEKAISLDPGHGQAQDRIAIITKALKTERLAPGAAPGRGTRRAAVPGP